MNSYGLALGGGGTKGAYHLGVWKALCDMNINVCAVTGCSIGSVNGALFAQGDFKVAEDIWLNIDKDSIIELPDESIGDNLLDIKNLSHLISDIYRNNGLETKPFRELIERTVDESKIRNSSIDFGLVTYDLGQREEISLFLDEIPDGQLVDYLMASASLPGLKRTVIGDKEYIDGGIANNIPADMLVSKGIKDIIAVDVGGVGITKGLAPKGVNIINIKSSEKIVGMLDFKPENIEKMIRAGYIDCLREFGRVEGNLFAFNVSDYHSVRQMYSQKIINGIESAADIFGVDRYKIYKFQDLLDGVLKKYNKYSKKGSGVDDKQLLVKFTGYILGEKLDDTVAKLFSGLMSDVTNAANSIAYFLLKQDN
ncbi:MAG: patatin-like phospholipase family protein [Clostridia bacterium]|nr:patatin-like phospholipase family protein [Clostridia bacterium]